MAKNKLLFIQDVPKQSHSKKKSQKTTVKLMVFKVIFKLIEALWMIVQIAQYFIEIFPK